ncbi:MAG: hypothetical protein ACYYKD_12545 [Rhodospirillales bacterium]
MADGTNVLTQLAQANADGEAIGQVASLSGDVVIVRADGSEVKGSQGTEIFQGDVVRTGGEGEVGLVFADDTTFSLGEDGEMTIDEMVYDPGSESGSAAFSVAKGVFGFVSGQLAKVDPDAMVIDTPVATIGIRGSSGTGRAAPEGEESTFILVPDPDGTIGEIIIQTETGTVVMNVPYQVSAVLSSFISPTQPVALPASVVAQVFGNTVEALAQARQAAGVDDTPPAAGSLDSVPAPTAEEAAAALAEADAGPEDGTAEEIIAAAGDEAALNAALEVSAEEAAAEAAAAAAAEAALEGAASEPVNEAAEAAQDAFDDALADGGSLVDAFRAAAQASEQKGAEVERQLEEEEQELDSVFGAADPDSIDKGLDNLLTQSKEAQEDGRSSAEAEEHEQLDEQTQDAADEALVDDLTALAAIQARAQLASGFSRLLTVEELAAKKAAEAAEQKAADAAAAAEEARRIEAEKKAQETKDDDGDGSNIINGSNTADDTLNGGGGIDTINGLGGNDIITGGGGADILDGGEDDDTFIYNGFEAVAGESVNGNSGDDTVEIRGTEDFTGVDVTNVENLKLSTSRADVTITKDQLNNDFTGKIIFESGRPQTLTIKTSGGFDMTTADLPTGRFDNYEVANHKINILVDTVGRFTYTGDAGANTFTGGAGVDTFNGGDGGDTLNGGGGNDVLNGDADGDNINGGDGNDSITGGAGGDILQGGAGDDTFYFSNGDVTGGESIYGGTFGGGDAGTGDKIVVKNGQNVDFTDAVGLLGPGIYGIETLQLEAGAEATFTSTQFDQFQTIDYAAGGAQTVNIQMDGATLDLSTAGLTLGSNQLQNHVFKITGTSDTETIIGSIRNEIITASMGGDTVTFGDGSDKLKFTSFDGFGVTVTDFDTTDDKITFGAAGMDLTDNTGTAAGRSVDFETITSGNNAARDLTGTTHQDNSIFEFTANNMKMAGTATALTAVELAIDVIGKDSLGTDGSKLLTVEVGAKNIFILYDTAGNAAVFYFDNTQGAVDDKVEQSELKLLAFLENVSATGGLDASNFEFATDPLIFDLDGDGETLTSQTVSFDTDGDGDTDRTTWFDSDDAMLVIDENGDGVINGMQEVVSSFLTYGGSKALGKSSLDALAMFDDNGDGQIDSSDAIYSVLRLWNDANGDGVTDEGELLNLADFGITRISLSGTEVNEETGGGTVQRTFEVERENGETYVGVEVSFEARDDEDPTASSSVV